MCVNTRFWGEQIGLQLRIKYRLGCAVIPIGWAPAVALMQELAERLTVLAGLPADPRIRLTSPLPPWLPPGNCCGSPRYHVSLDNDCSVEKLGAGSSSTIGCDCDWHAALEGAWASSGALSSAKKSASGEGAAQELGTFISGEQGTIGPSAERIMKLVQVTLVVISKGREAETDTSTGWALGTLYVLQAALHGLLGQDLGLHFR